jgi:Uma2 family endonuclease
MLETPVVMGVNAPHAHQRVIRRLAQGLGLLFDSGQINLEPLPEAMIDEGETSATPDIILFNNATRKSVVIIEVAAAGVKKDLRKIMELMDEYEEVKEGFVYDYRDNRWRKCKSYEGEILENPSFCDTIGYDLNEFVR